MLGSQALARFVIIRENPINSTGRLNKRKNTVRWGARPRLLSSLSRDRQKIFAKKRKRNTHIHIRAHTYVVPSKLNLSFFFSRLRYRLRSLDLSESRWRETLITVLSHELSHMYTRQWPAQDIRSDFQFADRSPNFRRLLLERLTFSTCTREIIANDRVTRN